MPPRLFLISTKVNVLTNECKMVYTPERDHSAIKIHIKSDELKYKRGPGFWKVNQSLLQDEIYVSSLRAEIPNFNQKYVDVEDLRLKWDLIKMEIRGFIIKYSKNTAKKRKSTKKNLQNQTNELYKKLKHHQITSKLSMKSMMPDRD